MNITDQKIINSILFFASKSSDCIIDRLKLMKLLWLADRIHLNKYARLILKDNYNALPHGPVPSKTMNFTKTSIEGIFEVDDYQITAKRNFDPAFFSKSDLQVMEYVWDKFGKMNSVVLRTFSHGFPEWYRFKRELEDINLPKSYPMIIDDFFNSPRTSIYYSHNEEESDNSKMIFHSHESIQSFLTKND